MRLGSQPPPMKEDVGDGTKDDRFKLLDRHRRQRPEGLQAFGKLSWSRCVLSLITYSLFLSDVIRTGLGVRQLSKTPVEPGVRMMFGPYNYPVVHLTSVNASLPLAEQRYWTYKHDTTSLSMRAVAKVLQLPAWSPCLHYDSTCDETKGLPGTEVFNMLDELIDRVRQFTVRGVSSSTSLSSMTLRMKHEYRDRLNEAVLPSIFYRTLRRTCQASFFTSTQLRSRSLCDLRWHHPFSCQDVASNFDRLCSHQDSCPGVGSIQERIKTRASLLQRAYPNTSLEMVVLDSVQDYARGALVSQGRRDFDIVTLIRVRQCDAAAVQCLTLAVDDYRYEGSVLVAGESEWFLTIATLRAVGQLYVWMRFAFFIGALIVVESQASISLAKKMRSVLRTFLFIPGHIVVYGSFIPVICYALAHLLDSSVVYERVREDFSALEGLFNFNFVAFIRSATISMRSVWIVASVCHIVTWISTHRLWTPEHGIPGVHKFFIAVVSSFTVLAHLRIPNWRDCRIVQIQTVTSSQRFRDIRAMSLSTRSTAGAILFGSPSDFQFIGLGLFAVTAIALFHQLTHGCLVGRRPGLAILFHTRVPYSSNWLWSSNALIVNWANVIDLSPPDKPDVPSADDQAFPKNTNANVALHSNSTQNKMETRNKRSISVMPKQHHSVANTERSTRILGLDHRTRDILAFIVTLNLTIMSDPLVFYQLRRVNASRIVGLYEHQATGKLWLLPLQSSASCVDALIEWADLRRLAVFTTDELTWIDLLHCG